MIRIFRRMSMLAAVAAMSMLTTSARAQGTLSITFTETGGTTNGSAGPYTVTGTLTGSGLVVNSATTSLPGSFIVGDYTITTASAQANQQPSGLNYSQVVGSALTITRNDTGTGTLQISVLATGYTYPTAPPAVSGKSSFAITSGNASNAADNVTLLSTISNATPLGGGFTPQTFNATDIGNGSAANTINSSITSLLAPYSMSQTIGVTLLTNGDEVGITSNTKLTAATPEPSSLAFAALGVVSGIAYGLQRRRKAQSF